MRHIRCGDDILPALERAGLPGTVHRWVDPLCQGPLRAGPREAWRPERADFIALSHPGASSSVGDVEQQLIADDAALDVKAGEEVVLWFEGDLFDEAIHWYLVAELSRATSQPFSISIVQLDGWPGVDPWYGLVSLTPEQLHTAFTGRRVVGEAEISLARDVWAAWTNPDLTLLDALRHVQRTADFPMLRDAIRRWLEELPAVGTGLGRTEQAMLAEAAREPAPWPQLFRRAVSMEERPWLGDTMWLAMAWRLALESDPLLSMGDELRVTDRGRAVLRGEIDRVTLNGYDGWHGAAHFVGRNAPFRWDPLTAQVIPARC